MTTVFVPQDLQFMGMTRDAIHAINPHLVPLIAHDRAGFGGALASFAVAMSGSVRYGRASKALWQALAIAGIAGFGAAVGVHPAIGYLSATYLAPANRRVPGFRGWPDVGSAGLGPRTLSPTVFYPRM
jgi:hypothetical protein